MEGLLLQIFQEAEEYPKTRGRLLYSPEGSWLPTALFALDLAHTTVQIEYLVRNELSGSPAEGRLNSFTLLLQGQRAVMNRPEAREPGWQRTHFLWRAGGGS